MLIQKLDRTVLTGRERGIRCSGCEYMTWGERRGIRTGRPARRSTLHEENSQQHDMEDGDTTTTYRRSRIATGRGVTPLVVGLGGMAESAG